MAQSQHKDEQQREPDAGALAGRVSPAQEAESTTDAAARLDAALRVAEPPDVPLLLNELIRLHLKQSDYAAAEPLLERLLVIKERQGADQREVATVLATLAAARKALGDFRAAEERYRDALRIREHALPPNHITTATTMESLAETCAARGHISEALELASRALAMREITLGADDPSVRSARERIADLQLQEVEDAPSYRATPSSHAAVPEGERTPIAGASRLPTVLVPYANDLAAIQQELEADMPKGKGVTTIERRALAAKVEQRTTLVIASTVGVLVLAGAVGITNQVRRTPSAPVYVVPEPDKPAAREAAVVPEASVPAPAPAVATTPAPAPAPVEVRHAPVVALQGEPRTTARARAEEPARLPPPIVPKITVPDIAPGTVANIPVKVFTDSFPDRLAPVVGKEVGAKRGAEGDRAPTLPKLIGAAPQPRYPDRLRELHIEGEVMVQFTVNEAGRADMASVKVLQSPHALLADAVRGVLPQFRFEPARTAAPELRPRAETVKYGFTFHVPER